MRIALIFTLYFLPFAVYSQVTIGPDIAWQECYGTSSRDYFFDAIVSEEHSIYAVARFGGSDGFMEGQDSMYKPATLMYFLPDFELGWIKNYGGNTESSGGTRFEKIFETNDNNLIMGGFTYDFDGDIEGNNGSADLVLLKADETGKKLWSHCYGSPGTDAFESFIPTMDGGYLIAGRAAIEGGDVPFHYGDTFGDDAMIIKTDSLGNIIWIRILGGSGDDGPLGDIVEIERGFYIINIGAHSDDYDLSESDILGDKRWVVKLDSLGNIVDENFISGTEDFYTFGDDKVVAYNNKILIGGSANPLSTLFPTTIGHGGEEYEYDGALGILDSNLDFIDLRLFGGSNSDHIKRFIIDSAGNYYFLGKSLSMDGQLPDNYDDGLASDYWLFSTDNNFNLRWSKNFGGKDPCGDLACSSWEGNLILRNNIIYCFVRALVPDVLPNYDIECGYLDPTLDDEDAWLVAFDLTTSIPSIESKHEDYTIYPNPATDHFAIKGITPVEKVSIFDLAGNNYGIFYDSKNIDIYEFPAGIYELVIETEGKYIINKQLIKMN